MFSDDIDDEWGMLDKFIKDDDALHVMSDTPSSDESLKPNSFDDPLMCPTCKIRGTLSIGTITCEKCGMKQRYVKNMRNYITDSNNYGISGDMFMSFKLIGQNAYYNNRSLMRTCSSYNAYSRNQISRQIHAKNFQHCGKKMPKDAINLAVEIVTQIRNAGNVFRGNGKWGVVGACLFYACVMKGITKTPREIADLLEVEEKFLSQGDRTLQDLNERGVIDIPTFLQPLPDYINQYFAALKIPNDYAPFIVDLIDRAEKKHIHITNESRLTTKCVGAILMLTVRVKSLNHITKDMICTECRISKSTFTRYYNLLRENHKKIRKVFKKHGIPMERGWKKSQPNTTKSSSSIVT